jgi:hypothetical protein
MLLLMCFFLSKVAYSQEKSKMSWTLGGQVALTSDFKENIFFNMGGPGVKLSQKPSKWVFSINMFPSLRWNTSEKDQNKQVTPVLGAGVQIFYKKLLISLPAYYLSIQNIWVGSVGVGVTF